MTTDSTEYTSTSTYPANETLYWRVRGNDTNTRHPGLNWSAVQTFKRTLPVPSPLSSNPFSTTVIPSLGWSPVTGAVGYEEHWEEPDGKSKVFKTESPADALVWWAGPGVWRWQVRALFPTGVAGALVPGAFTPLQPIAHTVVPPTGAVGVKSGGRIVISWEPQAYAKQYEVAISANETFSPASRDRQSHESDELGAQPGADEEVRTHDRCTGM